MICEFSGEYRFLSNFYIVDGGVTLNPVCDDEMGFGAPTAMSTEHLYQACKTFDDGEAAEILSARTPGEAKRLGSKIELRCDWDDVRIAAMRLCVKSKFDPEEHPELANMLLDTGNENLVEGNRWGDTFWGCELETGYGENHLGRILMAVRDSLNEIQY